MPLALFVLLALGSALIAGLAALTGLRAVGVDLVPALLVAVPVALLAPAAGLQLVTALGARKVGGARFVAGGVVSLGAALGLAAVPHGIGEIAPMANLATTRALLGAEPWRAASGASKAPTSVGASPSRPGSIPKTPDDLLALWEATPCPPGTAPLVASSPSDQVPRSCRTKEQKADGPAVMAREGKPHIFIEDYETVALPRVVVQGTVALPGAMGRCDQGKPSGEWRSIAGTSVTFVDGVLQGPFVLWEKREGAPAFKVAEGSLKDDRLAGLLRVWDKHGNLTEEGHYTRGPRAGAMIHHGLRDLCAGFLLGVSTETGTALDGLVRLDKGEDPNQGLDGEIRTWMAGKLIRHEEWRSGVKVRDLPIPP